VKIMKNRQNIVIWPLLGVAALAIAFGNSRKGTYTSDTIWNQVTTGPYGPRPGMTKGTVDIVFPYQQLQANSTYKQEVAEFEDNPNRVLPLYLVRDLFAAHPNINWRQSYLDELTKALQIFKYGYVFKDERHLVEYIMGMALIGNTDKWQHYFRSYNDFPIDYANDDLGRNPAPSMVDSTKSRLRTN